MVKVDLSKGLILELEIDWGENVLLKQWIIEEYLLGALLVKKLAI